ncbi:MAG: TrkH family potassium uptake protein [Ruminococcaceae bacterium]|nr:TrkH family potassium uptake protein [Oscillospiraceae bacterium]
MNYGIIRYVIGWVMVIEGAFMLLPSLTAAVYTEGKDAVIFLACAFVCAAIGALLVFKKPKTTAFYAREGFVLTALSWIVLSLVGTVPFVVSGAIPSFVDALFETVSGFTTTGASILTDVEALPHGMLFWRSFTHWIGGMGVLVFMLALLPMAGGHSMYLMKAESTGPNVSKLVPNIRKTALFLYGIYSALTVLQFVLLVTVGRMPLFDAICMAFGTAGTGGFGVLNDSIASYTVSAQLIITIFMVLFGVNFNFFFLLLYKRFKDAFKMEEVRWYLGLYVGVSLLISLNLWLTNGGSVPMILHTVFFQTASVMTTTGFATTDFALWPAVSQSLMVLLMCIGACGGSTGGGFKVIRVLLLGKSARKEFSHMLHPRNVKVIKVDGKAIERDTIGVLGVYLFCYVTIIAVSTVLLSLDGFDFTTNFTATIATVNNIGPGLSAVGPTGNFAGFSALSKIVCVFNMLIGRLEIFPMLLLFIPATWKK